MRQKNWESHFVQLNARPEGCPINPKVLSETAVIVLGCSQIDKRSQRCFHIAGRQQTTRALNEIPRPHEMIAAFSLRVPFSFTPRNGQGRHYCALKSLVLVCQKQLVTSVE